MKKTKEVEVQEVVPSITEKEKLETRQTELQDLLKTLEIENVRSVSDLEVKLSRINEQLRQID